MKKITQESITEHVKKVVEEIKEYNKITYATCQKIVERVNELIKCDTKKITTDILMKHLDITWDQYCDIHNYPLWSSNRYYSICIESNGIYNFCDNDPDDTNYYPIIFTFDIDSVLHKVNIITAKDISRCVAQYKVQQQHIAHASLLKKESKKLERDRKKYLELKAKFEKQGV